MIIELEVNGARVIISGEGLNVNVSGEDAPIEKPTHKDTQSYRPIVGERNRRHALKLWRGANGITQAEMAEMLGIGIWMVNAIETGRRVPSFALVEKIVKATNGGVQPNDFHKPEASV